MSNNSLLEYKLDLIAEALGAYKIESVASVIRRTFTRRDGEDADVVDLYPPWNAAGTYGFMKVATEYMDHDWQKKRFEKYAGVSFDSLPVFEAKQADQRIYGRPSKHEVQVRPFRLMLKPRPVENGPDEKTLILRYLLAGQVASQQPAELSAAPVGAPTPPPARNGDGNRNGRVNGSGSRQSQAVASPAEPPAKADAAGPVEFDDLVSATEQGLAEAVLKVQPWFKSTDNISAFRKTLFGEWQPGEAYIDAYFAGLLRYAELRKGQQSHQAAKIEALNRYHRELKETNHATNAG